MTNRTVTHPRSRGYASLRHRQRGVWRTLGAATAALLVASGLAVGAAAPAVADTQNTDRAWIDADQTFFAYTQVGETLDVNFTPMNIKSVDMNFEGGNQQATANVRQSVNVKVTAPDGVVTDCVIPHRLINEPLEQ